MYLADQQLECAEFQRGVAWLDTGTPKSLLEASLFVETIEKRQGIKVACLEEIAYEQNFISAEKVTELARPLAKTRYGQYLLQRINKK